MEGEPSNHIVALDSDLLSFLKNESIWVVVHVLLSYHTYLYSRNWRSVIMCYYLFVSLQLFLFSVLGWSYAKYFSELSEQGDEIKFQKACFGVTCNALFIGGTVQTFLGILMGMVHAQLFAPCKYDPRYFYPISFFKDYSLKYDKKYAKLKKDIHRKRSPPSREFVDFAYMLNDLKFEWGFWPWRLLLGWMPNKEVLASEEEILKLTYSRWGFRKRYWKRWFQLTLLGIPATIFLTLDGKGPLKAGLLLYGLITVCLLLIFKRINEHHYVNTVLTRYKKNKNDFSEETLKKTTNVRLTVMLNYYEKLYTVWIFSTVFVIGFYNIPFLTSFYRVLLAVSLVIAGSLILKLMTAIFKKSLMRGS